MNFSFYIFGTPDGYAQLPLDATRVLYEKFAQEKQANDQLIIYREGQFVYYSYLLQLENKEDYFGICLVFNGLYCRNVKKLFYFLKAQVHKNIVVRGKILQIDEWNKISFSTDLFTDQQIEVERDRVEGFLQKEIEERLTDDFVPITSDINNKNEKVVVVSVNDDAINIDETVQKYQYTMVTPTDTTYPRKNHKKKDKWETFWKWIWTGWTIIVSVSVLAFLRWISGLQINAIVSSLNIISVTCSVVLLLGLLFAVLVPLFNRFVLSKSGSKTINSCRKIIHIPIEKSKEDPFSIVGLFLAIASIFLTASWDTLLQYNKKMEPFEDLYKTEKDNKYEVKWSDYAIDTLKQKIVFIVDISGSVNTEIKNNNIDTRIRNLEEKIRQSGWYHSGKDYNCGNKYSDIVKARLMCLLYNLYEDSNKDNSNTGEYTLLTFANNPNKTKMETPITEPNLRQTFNYVCDSLEFNGGKTDFTSILTYLEKNYFINAKDQYALSEYTFIFLSDYIHESQGPEDKEKIIECLKSLRRYSIYPNFYFLRSPYVSKMPVNGLSISQLINSISDFDCELIDIISEKSFVNSKIKREKPLLFHYSSYQFSENVHTSIDFDNLSNGDNEFEIKIKCNKEIEDSRQEFFYAIDNDSHKLYGESVPFSLKSSRKNIDLIMKGHIPFQYPFTELIITDKDKHIEYFIEIVFIRELPIFFRWVIPLYIGLLGLYLILLCCPISLQKDEKFT